MESGAKYLSSLERGQENPTLEMLMKLARALQVDLVNLFNFRWLTMSEMELRKKIGAAADDADLARLREILAIMRARDV
jgi:transcriptional regulator with XRE-family HTH domain